MAKVMLLALATLVVTLVSLPDAAHAHAEPPAIAQIDTHDLHADGSETSGVGHCHGEASCSSGLHIVLGTRLVTPDLPQLPVLDQGPVLLKDTHLGREPPVPITLL